MASSGIQFSDSPPGHISEEEESENRPPVRVLPKRNETLAAVAAGFGPLAVGMAIGFSSPAIPQLEQAGLLTPSGVSSASWFASLFGLGNLLGSILIGYFVDYFGRKLTLMLAGPPLMIGWFCITTAPSFVWLYVGRILTGLACALLFAYPIYSSEVSSKEFRGAFGMIAQIGTTWGTAITFALSLCMNWQWLTVACMLPCVVMVLSMTSLPETPRWLLRQRRYEQAVRSLEWLRQTSRQNANFESEFLEIESIVLYHHQQPRLGLISRLITLRKQIITTCCLAFFQQFSGINAVIFYTDTIFINAGVSGTPGVPAVLFASVKASSTIIASLLVDKLGRRLLLISGSLGMAVGLFGLGAYFYLHDTARAHGLEWLPVASIVLYALSFGGGGWGGIPGLIVTEIFPLSSRAWGVCFCQVLTSALSFAVTSGFQPLESYIHSYSVFWLLAGVCVIGSVVICLIIPNTQRESLEHIQEVLTTGSQ